MLDVGSLAIDRILFYLSSGRNGRLFGGGRGEPEFDFGPPFPAHRNEGVSLLYVTFSLKQSGRLF